MPFKVVTAKEWEALGLPTEISTIHFGNTPIVKKMKENKLNKKLKSIKSKKKII